MAVIGAVACTAIALWAAPPKTGLWEATVTTTWQKSPFPPGSPMANMPFFSGKPITHPYCLTQDKIDKLEDTFTNQKDRSCQIANVQRSDSGFTADMICSGRMEGKGTVTADWSEGTRAIAKTHFAGTMNARSGPVPIEWSSENVSVYKGPDCGSVGKDK